MVSTAGVSTEAEPYTGHMIIEVRSQYAWSLAAFRVGLVGCSLPQGNSEGLYEGGKVGQEDHVYVCLLRAYSVFVVFLPCFSVVIAWTHDFRRTDSREIAADSKPFLPRGE